MDPHWIPTPSPPSGSGMWLAQVVLLGWAETIFGVPKTRGDRGGGPLLRGKQPRASGRCAQSRLPTPKLSTINGLVIYTLV